MSILKLFVMFSSGLSSVCHFGHDGEIMEDLLLFLRLLAAKCYAAQGFKAGLFGKFQLMRQATMASAPRLGAARAL